MDDKLTLFIGGDQDGKRLLVPEDPNFCFMIKDQEINPPSAFLRDGFSIETSRLEAEEYYKFQITSKTHIWVFSKLSKQEVIEKLITGYIKWD